jgi:type II secretion system protein I
MIAPTSPSVGRRGITLLEVLVSLAIFLFSLVAIGHLITISAERAVDVQMESQASQLCQSKLAEVVTGAEALQSSDGTFPGQDADWNWSVESTEGNVTGLWNVKVTVRKDRAEVSLSQMVLDPSYRGSSFDTPAASTSTDSSTSASTSSPSSSSMTGAASSSGGAASKPATSGGAASKPASGGGTMPSTGGGSTPKSPSGTGTTPSSGGTGRPTSGSSAPTSGTPAPRSGSSTPTKGP